MKSGKLHFDVSSGLKSVLGSELITDEEVAIFELVKNSFDANAKCVDLYFSDGTIIISDDGVGMSYDDIKSKWLLVAFSSKRESNKKEDFRDGISGRKYYAGSKGIGRFSADRLGSIVKLQTRTKSEKTGPVHTVTVDWNLFDKDHQTHFDKVDLFYKPEDTFTLPTEISKRTCGTAIAINGARQVWDREKILRLKSALAKLINPFGTAVDGFRIKIHAPAEIEADNREKERARKKGEEIPQSSIVNGEIGNFIFATLQEKTTFIDVRFDATGEYIESSLIDRGELIYHIREPNEYRLLCKSSFQCQLYFLNTSAKQTFARRMGVPSVQFGSVFLFRNGFRVFPIGEEGNDWYGMDRRKQQGYARFLGSRDVIGRIDVIGANGDFEETSSRNTGLILNDAVEQLRECFQEHCLKRLERYVVPVTFVDQEDRNTSDVSRLMTDPGRARVASAVAKLVDNKKIELLEYSHRLIGILNERSAQFEASLASLRAIAEKTEDQSLFKKIEEAEKRFEELRRSEEAAHRQADQERKAKEAAQTRAEKAEKAATQANEKYEEERKRSLFLASISSLDTETILNLHHQVTIYAVDIQQQIENFFVKIAGQKSVSRNDVVDALESISLLNRKVMGVTKFATKANFRLESETITENLGDYIEQYINGVAKDFLLSSLRAVVSNDGKGSKLRFKPIDISVVVDNLIANAKKAHATKIHFNITHPSKGVVHINVVDNGDGFSPKITGIERIFEKGFTTTDGSGLGLYHVKHVLGEMNGTIEVDQSDNKRGVGFSIKISK